MEGSKGRVKQTGRRKFQALGRRTPRQPLCWLQCGGIRRAQGALPWCGRGGGRVPRVVLRLPTPSPAQLSPSPSTFPLTGIIKNDLLIMQVAD